MRALDPGLSHEQIPCPVLVVARGTLVVLAANRAALALYGYARAELVGLRLGELQAEGDVATSVAAALGGGDERARRARHRRRDGTLFDVVLEAESHPAPSAILLLIDDVTARVREAAALRERGERFRRLTELSQDLVGCTGSDGNYTYLSPACRAILGYEPEELVGRSCFSLIVPEDLSSVLARYRTALAGEPSGQAVVFRMFRKDGTAVWVETTGRVFRSAVTGAFEEVQFSLRDITERKRAEEAVHRSEARLRELISGSLEAIVVHRDERIIFANQAHATVLGYARPEDLSGLPLEALIHPDDHGIVRERIAAMVASGAPAPLREMRWVRRDGGVVVMEVHSRPIEYDGAPAILASARDVTEHKELQMRMQQADRLASVGTLAAGVAHEINNPLTYVIANLTLASEIGAALPAIAVEPAV